MDNIKEKDCSKITLTEISYTYKKQPQMDLILYMLKLRNLISAWISREVKNRDSYPCNRKKLIGSKLTTFQKSI